MNEWRKVAGSVLVAASLLVAGAGPALAYHDDDGDCWEPEQCRGYDDGGGGGYDDGSRDNYDQWNSDQRNHNRRNRGAFSPGPFDRSPIEMHDVCISLDCSNPPKDDERRNDDQRDRRDRRGGPMMLASLFPPSPDAVRAFVVNTVKAGINMGRLFADTVITFVQDIFVGIA